MSSQKSPADSPFHAYEDLVFDLCHSTLGDMAQAQQLQEMIFHTLQKTGMGARFHTHERAWIFHVASEHLLAFHDKLDFSPSSADQIGLDALHSPASRLKHFDAYFHRLAPEDRLLLLMRDKYGLPYGEIAAAFGHSEESLRTRRARALRTLEEWLWSEK